MKDKKIPNILYLFLHSRIFYKFGEETNKKEATRYLFEWRIPSKLRPLILKEMIMLGLVEDLDRKTIKITRPEFNEEDCNHYYETLKIFTEK